MPPVGLAFVDTLGSWCASFATDSLEKGDRITLVFPVRTGGTSARAIILARRSSACGAAFPQHSVAELPAYDLSVENASTADVVATALAGMAVKSDAIWSLGSDGVIRADLDGDRRLEEAKVCAVDEGQLFTLRSGDRKVWQGYFDLGVLVDETCPPEERG